MRLGRRLPRSFFARSPTEVAPDLLGRVLVRVLPDGVRLAARLVETEAYEEHDPASHSYRGRTARTEVMFGPPGHLYVYFTYGMHYCMNVVVGRDGQGAAVLLRAAEPIEGLAAMAERRGTDDARRLCSGPARMAQAFGIEREANGTDLVGGAAMRLHEGHPVPPKAVVRTSRVGVTVGTGRPWRYIVRGDPFLSPGRPARITGRP
ncbi:MAG TPA: DNA-3-methyladenine glycosylase [Actinomycetota bacterium]|nr:DNA-3-methyladenine glycosylase [Actinomycetota bacterium]